MKNAKRQWNGAQVTLAVGGHYVACRDMVHALDLLAIRRARFPLVAFGNLVVDELAVMVVNEIKSYVSSRD